MSFPGLSLAARIRAKLPQFPEEARALSLVAAGSSQPIVSVSNPALDPRLQRDPYQFDVACDESTESIGEAAIIEGWTNLYNDLFEEPTEHLLSEENVLITALGGPGAGKTHSLFGMHSGREGLAYKVLQTVFDIAEDDQITPKVTISCVRIHSDTEVFDVLNGDQKVVLSDRGEVPTFKALEVGVSNEIDVGRLLTRIVGSSAQMGTASYYCYYILRASVEVDGIPGYMYVVDTPALHLPPSAKSSDRRLSSMHAYIVSSMAPYLQALAALRQKKSSFTTEANVVTRYLDPVLNVDSAQLVLCTLASTTADVEATAATLEFARRITDRSPDFTDILPRTRSRASSAVSISRSRAASIASASSLAGTETRVAESHGGIPPEDLLLLEAELRIAAEGFGYEPQLDEHMAHPSTPAFKKQVDHLISRLRRERDKTKRDEKRSMQQLIDQELAEYREDAQREFDAFKKAYEKEQEKVMDDFRARTQTQQADLVEQFSQKRVEYETRIHELTSKLSMESGSSSESAQELAKVRSALSKAMRRMKELEDSMDAIKAEATADNQQLGDENEHLKRELRKKIGQYQKVEEELQRLKKRMQAKNAELKKKDKKIKKLQAELKKKDEEVVVVVDDLPAPPPAEEAVIHTVDPDQVEELDRIREELESEKKKREELEFVVMELRSKLPGGEWLDDDDLDELTNKRAKHNPENMMRRTRDDDMEDEEYEGAFGHNSTIDLIERVLAYLEHGTLMVKHGRAGKPHLRYFHLNSERTRICWRDAKEDLGDAKEDHFVELKDVTRFVLGQHTEVFQRQAAIDPEDDEKSFSLIIKNDVRTLDCVCETPMEFEAWILGLSSLLNCAPYWGANLDLGPYPLSASLDPDERELCQKYRIIPDIYLAIKDISCESCWERGYLTKADIRVLGRIDFLRASAIHELMESRRWICSRPLFEDEEPLVDPFEDY